MGSTFLDSTKQESNKFRKKYSRKFQKAKFEFPTSQQLFTWNLHCIYSYLHNIYIVLDIVSNLEMILSIWEDVSRFEANTIPYYIRNFGIQGFWCLSGDHGTSSPPDVQGWCYIPFLHVLVWVLLVRELFHSVHNKLLLTTTLMIHWFYFFCFVFSFLGPHRRHMEVPSLGVKWELHHSHNNVGS